MSSNVGLPTPRGSGTSGYVQRNVAFMKPRDAGYGAPYPPVGKNGGPGGPGSSFKQRKPDKQILEHDRKRAIEVKVLEERERLEEENERIEEELKKGKSKDGDANAKKILSEEEIEERCNALRQRLLKELEEELAGGLDPDDRGYGRDRDRDRRGGRYGRDLPPKERKQFKSYQVHELAEAKIQESERFRKALGIKEDSERENAEKDREPYQDRSRDRDRDRDRGRY
ncbi:pre-mRNA-splicing factor cwc21 [Thermoascus aurantiacus ATCC 26904]